MTAPKRDLADYCEWLPEGTRRPCYAPASLVLVRSSGATLGFTYPEHAPGKYAVLERDEWEARGRGYRVTELGG